MKTLSKRIFAVVLTLAMTLTLTTWASAADFTDMPDNWAKAPLEAAVENGLLNGSDGLLRPTDYLTRAEMAAILVRAFGTTQSASVSGFSDVKANAWYVTQNAVPGAVFMEIMNGNSDGTFEPGKNITREQAFAVLARALKLEAGSSSVLAQFTDAAQISGWASGEVAAMVAAGYVNGSNGKLNPKGNITRQEFAQVMFNIFGDYISTAGTVTELGGKAVMINVPGVTVKDTTVHGDVIIGEGVGEGDVFFENVTIEGRVVVRGGGVNSIHFINSDSSQVLVSKIAGPVRIVADNASSVAEVAVIGGTDTVTVQGSVAKVAVEGTAPVVVKDATVGTVEVSSTAKVELDNAKVTTVAVNASNASVALTNGAAVATVDVAATAAGSTVTGEQGTTITTVKSDVSVTVAGDVKVNKTEGTGSVTDANGDVIATTPTSPSYPSGGSSGGSSGGGNKPGACEHTYGEYQQTVAPTCTESGKKVATCSKCGATDTQEVPATDHSYDGQTPVMISATKHQTVCKNCGGGAVEEAHNTTSGPCSCGFQITETPGAGTGECTHKYERDDEQSTTATCSAEGSLVEVCHNEVTTAEGSTTECGAKRTTPIPKTAHNFGDWTTKTEADCVTRKVEERTCQVANCTGKETKTGNVDTTNHKQEEAIADVAATCTTNGSSGGKQCTSCHTVTEKPTVVKALGHNAASDIETWTQTTTEHSKKCGRVVNGTTCEEVVVSGAHAFRDGTCTVCEYACQHSDETKLTYTHLSEAEGQHSHKVTCNTCSGVKTESEACTQEAIGENKDATCTEGGTTAGIKCSKCEFVIKAAGTTNPAGHKYPETGHTDKCTECGNVKEGHVHKFEGDATSGTCTTCGATVSPTTPDTTE